MEKGGRLLRYCHALRLAPTAWGLSFAGHIFASACLPLSPLLPFLLCTLFLLKITQKAIRDARSPHSTKKLVAKFLRTKEKKNKEQNEAQEVSFKTAEQQALERRKQRMKAR